MKIEGNHLLAGTRERVWSMLMDPEVLTRCLPGCEKLEKEGDHEYAAHLKLGIAAIKGSYTGRVRMEDLEPPRSYRMFLEGKGTPGFVRGEATIRLEEQDQGTELVYSGESQVGGPIASIGQRMLQGVARTLIRHFFKAFEKEVRESGGIQDAP